MDGGMRVAEGRPRYEPEYFAHFSAGASRSAEVLLPIVRTIVPVRSVADFGCGTGAWLAVWERLGVTDVIGCDGPYVDVGRLAFNPAKFVPADLSQPVRIGRRVDLVQSLEVAEHLPACAAATFVDTLI